MKDTELQRNIRSCIRLQYLIRNSLTFHESLQTGSTNYFWKREGIKLTILAAMEIIRFARTERQTDYLQARLCGALLHQRIITRCHITGQGQWITGRILHCNGHILQMPGQEFPALRIEFAEHTIRLTVPLHSLSTDLQRHHREAPR